MMAARHPGPATPQPRLSTDAAEPSRAYGRGMFHRIVVGADGYAGTPDALALALSLVADHGEVVIVDVFPDDRELDVAAQNSYEQLLHDDARALLESSGRPDVTVRVKAVGHPSPADALREAAASERADLIVVSVRSRHAGRLLAQHEHPVAVVPRGYRAGASQAQTLGVGFDGSDDAHAAVRLAQRLAEALGARVHLRTAVEVASPASQPSGRIDYDDVLRRARIQLTRLVADLGIDAETDVVLAAPHAALQALSQQVDIMFVGAPGKAKRWRLLTGSPAESLALHAGCPMIVVPASAIVAALASRPAAAAP